MVQNEYKCKACDATFDSERELERHNRTIHAPHKCEICGRTFQSESELKIHTRISHPEDVPVPW
jgi:DNA-directed RNA polymerase subunit RPC12/RpoP